MTRQSCSVPRPCAILRQRWRQIRPPSKFYCGIWNVPLFHLAWGDNASLIPWRLQRAPSPRVCGAAKCLSRQYVLLPQTLKRIALIFFLSVILFAMKNCCRRSTHWVHDSSASLNSPTVPYVAILRGLFLLVASVVTSLYWAWCRATDHVVSRWWNMMNETQSDYNTTLNPDDPNPTFRSLMTW